MIVESKSWYNKWNMLRAQGIDGFIVGIPKGQHPGPITFDLVCDMCSKIIKNNTLYPRGVVYCFDCELKVFITLARIKALKFLSKRS